MFSTPRLHRVGCSFLDGRRSGDLPVLRLPLKKVRVEFQDLSLERPHCLLLLHEMRKFVELSVPKKLFLIEVVVGQLEVICTAIEARAQFLSVQEDIRSHI